MDEQPGRGALEVETPLTIDLWFSRSNLAALKARDGTPLDEDDRTAVERLLENYRRRIRVLGAAEHLDSIEPEGVRNALIETYALLGTQASGPHGKEVKPLERIVASFGEVLEGRALATERAGQLLDDLQRVGRRRMPSQTLPDVAGIN